MDLSIIIPHRGDGLGLWATITSCAADLESTNLEHEYVVVTNGGEVPHEVQLLLKFLDSKVKHAHSDEALTPPTARAKGVEVATGNLLFFFDNHVTLEHRYFERAVADFTRYPTIASLHSGTRFFAGDLTHYHYRLKLARNFWGETGLLPASTALPYKIAAAGHGGFVVKRTVWDAVGGYGPEDLFAGYAGEEFTFDLKLWRMGYENWLDPKLVHYHWAGNRSYPRHYTDDYYRNLMVSALVIGGEKWLDTVYHSFTSLKTLRMNPQEHMFDLMQQAYARGHKYAEQLDSTSVRSLDECLDYFQANCIADK